MAQIDHSIYSQLQAPDIAGSIQQGMTMRQMIDANNQKKKMMAEQDAIKKVYTQNTKIGEDGAASLDRKKTMSDLVGMGHGDKAIEQQKQWGIEDAEKQSLAMKQQQEKIGMIARLAGNISDQASYDSARQTLIQRGIVKDQDMPMQYDKGWVDNHYRAALTAEDQLKQKMQQQDLASKEKWNGVDADLKRQELYSRALDRKEARDERRFQAGIKMDEKNEQLTTPFGLAHTVDDAKKIKEGFESKEAFDNKLNQMIALREKHGGGAVLNREDVARGKQLSKDLLLEYKNMAKLGVLSKSDEDIINAIIPEDPLEYNSPFSALTGQDPTLNRLKEFQKDSDENFRSRVATRVRGQQAIAGGDSSQRIQKDSGFNLIPEAHAGAGNFESLLSVAPQMQGQDVEALKWASQNKNDPRAEKILMNLNGKYGGQ